MANRPAVRSKRAPSAVPVGQTLKWPGDPLQQCGLYAMAVAVAVAVAER